MSKCKDCTIGILNHYEYYDLVTAEDIKITIKARTRYNAEIRNEYGEIACLLKSEWDESDYFDRRKSTDLTRFNFCPYCGNRIDWRKLKHE